MQNQTAIVVRAIYAAARARAPTSMRELATRILGSGAVRVVTAALIGGAPAALATIEGRRMLLVPARGGDAAIACGLAEWALEGETLGDAERAACRERVASALLLHRPPVFASASAHV